MRRKGAIATDARVARIAASQHGLATLAQLQAAGLSPEAISRRVAAERLHRVFRGVYAVGHPGLGNEGRWMAAVLACGEGAVLSHRSAAELWGLLPPQVGGADVTVPSTAGRRRRTGIRLHRSRSLPNSAKTRRNAIAVTTPARTLADLRRAVPPAAYRRAVRQAEFLGLDLGAIETDRTRGEAERLFLRTCRRYRLPPPAVNVRLGPFVVDFLWRAEGLIVETDGYAAHRGRQAFEDDRARELELHARGYRVRRFTYAQVRSQWSAVAQAVRAELRR